MEKSVTCVSVATTVTQRLVSVTTVLEEKGVNKMNFKIRIPERQVSLRNKCIIGLHLLLKDFGPCTLVSHVLRSKKGYREWCRDMDAEI